MRCPKCQYIGLGDAARCRNCGYEFSLSAAAPPPLDLAIVDSSDTPAPLVDLPLSTGALREGASALEARPVRGSAPSTDLPLFGDEDDTPLVDASAVPRPPLAVRRPAPVLRPRRSADPEADSLLDLNTPFSVRPSARRTEDPAPTDARGPAIDTASAAARLFGGAIDGSILLAIDAAVVYLTLRVSGLELADARRLLSFPMVAFLLLLNGGYLVLFTAAAGQTIGKMAARTRVVPEIPGEDGHALRLPFSAATVRGAAYLLSLLPIGLGLLPILASADRRALHDRLAGTRVIRA